MIISKTPYRVSFFGGGTDYPTYCKKYGGQVLSTSIDKYCYISLRKLPPFFQHKHRMVYSQIENVMEVKDITHPAIREMMLDLKLGGDGLEIHHDGDLPARAGLGSSSSFCVGLYSALSALQNQYPDHKKLADYAIYLEQNVLNENVGYQDQIAVAFGGFNHITFHQGGGYDVLPVGISPARTKILESNLLLFFTGITRFASPIAEKQIQSNEINRKTLVRMGQMVDVGLEILTDSNANIDDFGALLDEAWQYKKSLTDLISSDEIDDIYSKAKKAGAIGGKILGAGGGGFFLLFAHPGLHTDIKNALNELVHVPFKFETSGSSLILKDVDGTHAV